MPTHVRLKYKDRNKTVVTSKVTELAYGKFNVPFTRIFQTNEGYKAICRNDDDADKMLTDEARQAFAAIGLNIIMPPEIKAKRTIFVRKVDKEIGSHTAEEIKANLELNNQWMKIAEVTKIKDYTHVFKICFRDTQMADKALDKGFLAFRMSITPDTLEREKFTSILTCFKCYKFEAHQTKDCPETSKFCSECAEEGHFYTECTNTHKACLNCTRQNKTNNNHRTLAMACPIKKELIKKKENTTQTQQTNKQHAQYAAVVKQAVKEAAQPTPNTVIQLSDTNHLKILMAVVHAHVVNICNPGTYAKELNLILKKNNLQEMWFPDNPDSGKLFQATATPQLITEVKQKYTETPTPKPTVPEQQQQTPATQIISSTPQQTGAIAKTTMYSSVNSPASDEEVEVDNMSEGGLEDEALAKTLADTNTDTADDIGLTVFVNTQQPLPTKDIHINEIIEGIQNESLKWTYTQTKIPESYVATLISEKAIKIRKHNFKKIDDNSFLRLRNGLVQVTSMEVRHRGKTRKLK